MNKKIIPAEASFFVPVEKVLFDHSKMRRSLETAAVGTKAPKRNLPFQSNPVCALCKLAGFADRAFFVDSAQSQTRYSYSEPVAMSADGNDGGSLMSPAELDNLGIANVNLVVKNQNGKTIASVDGKRAWPNVYNFFDHSKKTDIYTETRLSFYSKEQAFSFYNLLNDKIEKSDYNYQFDVKPNGNEVTITWGKTK